jgi:hypothetical protein
MGLEPNDFLEVSGGLFGRRVVRDYARVVGLDAGDVVDDFAVSSSAIAACCRRCARGELGHELEASDEPKLIPAASIAARPA